MPALILSMLAACGGKDDTAPPSDDTAPPGLCDDPVTANWDNFGRGFLTENCQACHAADAAERNGAPETVTFDTIEDVATHQDRILARVLEGSMPPSGGVSDDDVAKLEVWLTCFFEDDLSGGV